MTNLSDNTYEYRILVDYEFKDTIILDKDIPKEEVAHLACQKLKIDQDQFHIDVTNYLSQLVIIRSHTEAPVDPPRQLNDSGVYNKETKQLLGMYANDIRGNDSEWVIDFLRKLQAAEPGAWTIERDDVGLYLFLGDYEIKESKDDDECCGEVYIADTTDFMDTPLASGETCDLVNDDCGVEHCEKLLNELGINI